MGHKIIQHNQKRSTNSALYERAITCSKLTNSPFYATGLFISYLKFTFKVDNRNTRKISVICSRLRIKTPERYQ